MKISEIWAVIKTVDDNDQLVGVPMNQDGIAIPIIALTKEATQKLIESSKMAASLTREKLRLVKLQVVEETIL